MKVRNLSVILVIGLLGIGIWYWYSGKKPVDPLQTNLPQGWVEFDSSVLPIKFGFPKDAVVVENMDLGVRINLPDRIVELERRVVDGETLEAQSVPIVKYVEVRGDCMPKDAFGAVDEETVSFSGREFKKYSRVVGAAGSTYNSETYQTTETNGTCYQFDFVEVHPTSLGVYYSAVPADFEEKYNRAVVEEKEKLSNLSKALLQTVQITSI